MNNKTAEFILAQNQKTYNAIAKSFSETRNRSWPEVEFFIQNYVKTGQNCLDIGCGNGRVFELLQNYKVNYTGIDLSSQLIAEAKNKFPQAEFLTGDILDFNTKQNFDIVFCLAVLNHLPTVQQRLTALTNIYQSLNNNGYLLLTNWNLWQWQGKKSWWRLKLQPTNLKFLFKTNWKDLFTFWGQDKQLLYYHAFTLNELVNLLQTVGFKIIDSYHSLDNKKARLWRAKNLVIIVKK